MRGKSLVVVRGRDWRSAHCTGDDDSRGACGNVSVEMVAGAARTAVINSRGGMGNGGGRSTHCTVKG